MTDGCSVGFMRRRRNCFELLPTGRSLPAERPQGRRKSGIDGPVDQLGMSLTDSRPGPESRRREESGTEIICSGRQITSSRAHLVSFHHLPLVVLAVVPCFVLAVASDRKEVMNNSAAAAIFVEEVLPWLC